MSKIYGPDGQVIPTGHVHKRHAAPFGLETALPSWLEGGAGSTITTSSVAASAGSARATTTAVLNSEASIRTVRTFDANALSEIAVTVQGVQMSGDADISTRLRLDDAGTSGVALMQNQTETVAMLKIATPGGNFYIPTNYQWRSGGKAGIRRNLTLRLRTKTKEVFIEEDGQVYGYIQDDRIVLGQVRPLVGIQTNTAAAAWAQCEQFIVETWSA